MISFLAALAMCLNGSLYAVSAKELLTEKEIDQLRDYQEIDKRAELYIKFAALRLETFKQRIKGIESKEGDPLEFHSLEDLIRGYTHCIKSLEGNIDDAVTYKNPLQKKLISALERLKNGAEKFRPSLEEASNYAVAKQEESLYYATKEAIETTQVAIEGAKAGLEHFRKSKKP